LKKIINKSSKTTKKKKKISLSWDGFGKKVLGPGLEKFYRELIKLKGKEFTAEYLKALQHFKPLLRRDEYIGDVPPINLKEMPREVLIKLRDATSEAERNRIIKKYYRDRNKTTD